jgi:hypothetical protein
MTMTVELQISGLVNFYTSKRQDFWHAVFICDADHPVTFKHADANDWTPLHVQGKDRFISISADRARIPDSLQGDGFEQILNMARPEMHGAGNLSVKRNGKTDVISMTIPAAKLGMIEETPFEYYILNTKKGEYHNVGPVARITKATIELDDGNGLTMLVQDGDGTTELANFPFKDGESYVLEFDNDCGIAGKAENDFIRYYDWVKDKNGTTFWAGRIDEVLAEAEKNNDMKTKSFDEVVVILSVENGNCDPTVIVPPPKQP